MARRSRLNLRNQRFHVYNRGNNREMLFLDDEDCRVFLEIVCKVKGRIPFELEAICLMRNHFHMAVKSLTGSLSQIMHRIQTIYAMRFNKRHARTGHVFEDRYKSPICIDDGHFKTLFRYIHQNPVRAGLVESPRLWKWSSVHAYAQTNSPFSSIVDTRFPISLFGRDKSVGRSRLLEFLETMPDQDETDHVREWLRGQRTGTPPHFSSGEECREDSAEMRQPMESASIETLAMDLCGVEEIEIGQLIGRSKRQRLSALRRELVLQAQQQGHTLASIARYLRRSATSVARLSI